MKASENCYKLENTANPISPNVFCADPTGVEYNGRLYIYGTNDHQQYEAVGDDGMRGGSGNGRRDVGAATVRHRRVRRRGGYHNA